MAADTPTRCTFDAAPLAVGRRHRVGRGPRGGADAGRGRRRREGRGWGYGSRGGSLTVEGLVRVADDGFELGVPSLETDGLSRKVVYPAKRRRAGNQ
jgi:hypothetical protein